MLQETRLLCKETLASLKTRALIPSHVHRLLWAQEYAAAVMRNPYILLSPPTSAATLLIHSLLGRTVLLFSADELDAAIREAKGGDAAGEIRRLEDSLNRLRTSFQEAKGLATGAEEAAAKCQVSARSSARVKKPRSVETYFVFVYRCMLHVERPTLLLTRFAQFIS